MLYLIGTGLGNEKSLSLEAVEALKKCSKVYLESYTSVFQGDARSLEKLIGKGIKFVDRGFVEKEFDIADAKDEDVALLFIGDVFSATTHISIYNDCKNKNIEVRVLNNASIITAVGVTGLSLYNFGKISSIPFNNENMDSPINILNDNIKINAHTLFLLDLDPENEKFLSIKEAIEYLEKREVKSKIIGCARLGSDDFIIKYGNMQKVREEKFGNGPYCLIVPAKKLHFMEEEVLEKWKI